MAKSVRAPSRDAVCVRTSRPCPVVQRSLVVPLRFVASPMAHGRRVWNGRDVRARAADSGVSAESISRARNRWGPSGCACTRSPVSDGGSIWSTPSCAFSSPPRTAPPRTRVCAEVSRLRTLSLWWARHSERVRSLDTSAHTRVLGGAVLGGLEKAQDGVDQIEPPSLTGDLVQAQPDGPHLLR